MLLPVVLASALVCGTRYPCILAVVNMSAVRVFAVVMDGRLAKMLSSRVWQLDSKGSMQMC